MAWTRPHNRPRRNVRPDVQAGLGDALAMLQARTGFVLKETQKIIPDDMTFRQWCEKLSEEVIDPRTGQKTPGLKVDGKAFRLDDRPAMAWIYDQVPSTIDEAYRYTLVLMKCAQVGFTVLEMLAAIYLGLKFQPATVGMFLPDMNLAGLKSSERFMPIVRTVPDAHKLMTQDAADGSGRKSGEGNVRTRRIGESMYVFSWTSGRATTESIPMDVLSFDEVQEMTLEQMEKTRERLSASKIRFTLMGSTANWPDLDIHHWYKRGTQYRFHTECPTCRVRKPLDDYFPDCIKWDNERDIYRYVCEAGHWIEDSQNGEWIADNPDADRGPEPGVPLKERRSRMCSIHFSQFLSPDMSAGEILEAYNNATDMKNFFNRKLGKPYLDPSQIPVTLEHMANCVKHGMAAGVRWKSRARGAFMGIDQMGQFNVVVIKERLPDGRQAVIHVEEIYSDDPFGRCSELMDAYGVSACVVECNPNYNDAQRFAKRHDGRVFLCDGFGSLPDDMVRWGDAPKLDVSDRRTDDDLRTRYTVKADQFKFMQAAMARFTADPPLCLWPDPKGLVQEVIEKGQRQLAPVAPRAFLHFTKTALISEKDEEKGTNKYKRVVRKVGIDPHFSYANQLCDVAWSRAHGTAQFIIPPASTQDEERRAMAEQMGAPGMPVSVMAMLDSLPTGVCGRCTAFPVDDQGQPLARGTCLERGFIVQATDQQCDMFVEAG